MPKTHGGMLSDEALGLIAARFRVLGEPSRLRLLQVLRGGECTVSELVEATGLAQANASRHLQALADAALVDRRREGLNVVYRIADPSIFTLCETVCGSLKKRLSDQARVLAG